MKTMKSLKKGKTLIEPSKGVFSLAASSFGFELTGRRTPVDGRLRRDQPIRSWPLFPLLVSRLQELCRKAAAGLERLPLKRQKVSEISTWCGLRGMTLFVLSAVLAVLLVPSTSYADTISQAVFSVSAAGGDPITHFGTVRGTGNNTTDPAGGIQSSIATAFYANGVATASASGSTAGLSHTLASTGDADVTFYFLVSGSLPTGTKVPLIFTGTNTASISGLDNNAYAEALFSTPGGTIGDCANVGSFFGVCLSPIFQHLSSGSIPFTAQAGTQYSIDVRARGASDSGTGGWSAMADPEVTIDPSFAFLSSVSLVFSPNVAPPMAAPEPSSLLMVGAGLLGLIGARRWKRLA